MKSMLAHITCWVVAIILVLAFKLRSADDPLTVVIPKGRALRIVEANVSTSSPPPMPMPWATQQPIFPRSALLREWARQPRPGAQRFKAVKVEEHAANRSEDDGELRTNYIVTWLAIPDGTNPVLTWGAIKARTLRTESRWPTKKDDEWEFAPVEEKSTNVMQ